MAQPVLSRIFINTRFFPNMLYTVLCTCPGLLRSHDLFLLCIPPPHVTGHCSLRYYQQRKVIAQVREGCKKNHKGFDESGTKRTKKRKVERRKVTKVPRVPILHASSLHNSNVFSCPGFRRML